MRIEKKRNGTLDRIMENFSKHRIITAEDNVIKPDLETWQYLVCTSTNGFRMQLVKKGLLHKSKTTISKTKENAAMMESSPKGNFYQG